MLAKLTATQAASLIAARSASIADRKATKRRVFAEAKAAFGIPASTKLRVELDNTSDPNYLVLRHKHTGIAITAPDTQGSVSTPSTATPLPTPATVNQADVAVDAKVADAPAADAQTASAPGTFRFVVVKRSDVFTSLNYGCLGDDGGDEVVVRIPA